jgi:hypothetical protein
MDTKDWCGLVVRTRAGLRFGVVAGVFTEGPHAGRLRVHGPYRFGGGTQAEWQGTLVYAIPPDQRAILAGADQGGACAGVTAGGRRVLLGCTALVRLLASGEVRPRR